MRRGIRDILAEEFGSVHFTDANVEPDGIRLVQGQEWDLIIANIGGRARGRSAFLTELKAARPAQRMLILAEGVKTAALREKKLGLENYIAAESAPEELIERVRKAIESVTPTALGTASKTGHGRIYHTDLSGRELEVLRLIGVGKTLKEISAILTLSEKTVGTYRSRILAKLKLKTTGQLIRYALKNGLAD